VQTIQQKMKEVTVQQLKELQDSNADFQLIDVREEYEYEEMNIGALLIPMGEVVDNLDKISKDKQVVIHCKSGARSGSIINLLESQFGYTNLYNLKGGILAYKSEIGL
jgi:adenylyltransferase/sulfurtransferase